MIQSKKNGSPLVMIWSEAKNIDKKIEILIQEKKSDQK